MTVPIWRGTIALKPGTSTRVYRRSILHPTWSGSIQQLATTICRLKSSKVYVDDVPTTPPPPLMEFRQVKLQYPSTSNTDSRSIPETPIDLSIHPPSNGGHVLLGPNGCGKSLLLQAIASHQQTRESPTSEGDGNSINPYLQDGELSVTADGIWHSRAVAHVSFSSHQELLQEGGTASKAISEGGNLSKAAQFLVVRFGLFPLLQRDVTTLSTGEIRKVLLVRALSTRPRLLILDNAFDGLDVPSRDTLKDLVSKTLLGFTMDILVQAVNANATAHTQVLIATHRAEEIVDEIETVSSYCHDGVERMATSLQTIPRDGRSGMELLHSALDMEESLNNNAKTSGVMTMNWDDDSTKLPSFETVKDWWQRGLIERDDDGDGVMINTRRLNVQRGDVTLLHDLDWTVQKGERWLVAGGNGAGKSTLSRLLARPNEERHLSNPDALQVMSAYDKAAIGSNSTDDDFLFRDGVDYVSTELHMQMADSDRLANDILLKSNSGVQTMSPSTKEDTLMVADWLGLSDPDILSKKFVHLSQGQQKLLLIASALTSRSPLVILDEPCQGLDLKQRQLVLMVAERICQSTDMTLIYITHHFEELLPSVSHVLHLKDRKDVFNGKIEDYNPAVVASS